jgi:hypothetical protein
MRQDEILSGKRRVNVEVGRPAAETFTPVLLEARDAPYKTDIAGRGARLSPAIQCPS